MGMQLADWVENIVGKGKIAREEQFLLFPQCFQKLSVVDASKWVSIELRVKMSAAQLSQKQEKSIYNALRETDFS